LATCVYCSKSGWLLLLDNLGLCDWCHQGVLPLVISQEKVMHSSIKIADSSKNPSVQLTRLSLAIDACSELKAFEERGFPFSGQRPSITLTSLRDWYEKLVPAIALQIIHGARQRAASATTDAARLRPFSVALDQIRKLTIDVPSVSLFRDALLVLGQEQDRLRFELAMRKAELAEMKGKISKAVEYTIDALAGLTYDQSPDATQADMFQLAKDNIRRLGADVPPQFGP
jgi:hypothetical protein